MTDTRQAIHTQYLQPTNHRGSKLKATAQIGSVTLSWGHGHDPAQNHHAAALALAKKYGWAGDLIGGQLADGSYVWVVAK